MNITPATPTVNDFISLHYDASFPSSGCALLTQNVSIIGNNIIVDAQHEQGMITVICNGSETIPIGYLPMGVYTLTLNVQIPGSSTSQAMTFEVYFTVDLPEQQYEYQEILICSNNSDRTYRILKRNEYQEFSIYSYTGQLIKKMPFSNKIEMSEYPAGLYVLVFASGNEMQTLKVIAE